MLCNKTDCTDCGLCISRLHWLRSERYLLACRRAVKYCRNVSEDPLLFADKRISRLNFSVILTRSEESVRIFCSSARQFSIPPAPWYWIFYFIEMFWVDSPMTEPDEIERNFIGQAGRPLQLPSNRCVECTAIRVTSFYKKTTSIQFKTTLFYWLTTFV